MKRRPIIYLALLILSLIFFYWQSFSNFFFQDDFFNLKLASEHNLADAFNLFKKPILDFYFYRPFSTQLYWFTGQKLFGLSPIGYHIVDFTFFAVSILLVYQLAFFILKNEKASLLASFFYGFSASHFYRLFFISQFQELSLAVFTLFALLFFLKKSWWSVIFFILALTTKETAVMIVPFMLFIIFISGSDKKRWKIFFICLTILLFYLYARIAFFGFSKGGVYQFVFGPKQVLNNYFWYTLWSLGLPEAFVNIEIFKLPTIINPKIFTLFGVLGNYTIAFFGFFLALTFLPLVSLFKKIDRKIIFGLAFFICFLLPVAFFPFHKFPYSVTLPLFGISLILGYSCAKLSSRRLLLICFVYFFLSLSAYKFNLLNHWVSKKARVAKVVFEYFLEKCPNKIGKNIYFRNTLEPKCLVKRGLSYSQEISYAIGGEDGLRFLYGNKNLPVYFEDIDLYKHFQSDSLVIDSSLLINKVIR